MSSHPSCEAMARTLLGAGSSSEITTVTPEKSDIPKAVRVGRVPVKRIPILVDDLIKKGYARFEERQVREGDVLYARSARRGSRREPTYFVVTRQTKARLLPPPQHGGAGSDRKVTRKFV